jgi:hypothetical protein
MVYVFTIILLLKYNKKLLLWSVLDFEEMSIISL